MAEKVLSFRTGYRKSETDQVPGPPPELTQVSPSLFAPPPTPDKRFQDYVKEYVTNWMKASREFVKQKETDLKRLLQIYENELLLKDWQSPVRTNVANELAEQRGQPVDWRSEMVFNPAHIINNWADSAIAALFGPKEYIRVVPQDVRGSIEDMDFPTANKLEHLLLSKLEDGEFQIRTYEALHRCGLWGTVIAKCFWYTKDATRYRWARTPLSHLGGLWGLQRDRQRIYDCPITQMIQIERCLPDWTATHFDLQRWSGVGHRVELPYQLILEQFDRGLLYLNRKDVEERLKKEIQLSSNITVDAVTGDPDRQLISDKIPKLDNWEWHGLLPTREGYQECVVTITTPPLEDDDPTDGVMTKLNMGPVLWTGDRPFVGAQFTPSGKPFGYGALHSSMDLIFMISLIMNQLMDNGRLTNNCILKVKSDSDLARKLAKQKGGNEFYPGATWLLEHPDDASALDLSGYNPQNGKELASLLLDWIERRSYVTETRLGMWSGRKSASEAVEMGQRADLPFNVRVAQFAQTYLQKAAQISLGMLQQFILRDQIIMVPSPMGTDVPMKISAEEIVTGRYRAIATFLREDQQRQMKAQSLERAMQNILQPQVGMSLAQDGFMLNRAELIRQYLRYLGLDNSDRIVVAAPPPVAPPQGAPGGPRFPPGSAPPGMGPPPQMGVGARGGPMGQMPNDANAQMQMTQENMRGMAQGGPPM